MHDANFQLSKLRESLDWRLMSPDARGTFRKLRRKRLELFSIITCVFLAGCGSPSSQNRPSIEMSYIPASGQGGPDRMDTIAGRVNGSLPGQQIVLYAKNDIWWLQPLWSRPFTNVEKDGTWKNFTHLGTDYAVLLVDPGFHPQPRISALPAVGNGVAGVLAVKGTSIPPVPLKIIHFSGYDWKVRSGATDRGGELNAYDSQNAWVDPQGHLHLHMGERDGLWSCAEISLTRSLGYGTYKFVVQDSAHLEPSGMLGLFTVDERRAEETRIELDVELSQWGQLGSKNAQYVVQPYYIPQNIVRFTAPAGVLTHILHWEPSVASFKTVVGAAADKASKSISEHVFTSGIPAAGGETVHIDLYDFYHSKSKSQHPTEVVIEKFEYLP
jgi:hypothetical protein